jgi:RNA polymerase sigma-70 factor (ECF subfamily)
MTFAREDVTGVSEQDWLAQLFEEHRRRLRAVAYRMLGSISEADDAVQEAWLRLSASEPGEIENLSGWLTTVVTTPCRRPGCGSVPPNPARSRTCPGG